MVEEKLHKLRDYVVIRDNKVIGGFVPDCPCLPEIEVVNGEPMVIHNRIFQRN